MAAKRGVICMLLGIASLSFIWFLYLAFFEFRKIGTSSGNEEQVEIASSAYIENPILAERYALVIDAGSSGTRIHVYKFLYNGKKIHSLVDEVYFEVPIGLSAMADEIDQLEQRIFVPMLEIALKNVPEKLHSSTCFCLKATAGLRLIPKIKADAILIESRRITSRWPFPPEENDPEIAVDMVPGDKEGYWAWISVNMLLGFFGHEQENNLKSGHKHVGVLDLGGASTQVAFLAPGNPVKSAFKDYISILTVSGKEYPVFRHSFLEYGMNVAQSKVMASLSTQCGPSSKTSHKINVHGCLLETKQILNLTLPCGASKCFYNGVPMPDDFSFHDIEVYAFSNFYDIIRVFSNSTEEKFSLSLNELWGYILFHCELKSVSEFKQRSFSSISSVPNFCFNAVYIYSLLKDGYKIDNPDYKITLVKKIRGFETCWALGAAVHMLASTDLK